MYRIVQYFDGVKYWPINKTVKFDEENIDDFLFGYTHAQIFRGGSAHSESALGTGTKNGAFALRAENVECENFDRLGNKRQIHQYFPAKNFVLYGTS